MAKKVKIKQVKSTIGRVKNQRLTVKALGLKKVGCTVIHEDTLPIRGMINRVKHLVHVEDVSGE